MRNLKTKNINDGSSAFTLVELLVGVAIIATLLALLIPVLSSAKSAAINAKCVTNLRSLGSAMQHYIIDKEGKIVTRLSGGRGGGDIWPAELASRGYLAEGQREEGYKTLNWKDPELAQCPSGALPESINFSNWAWFTYGLNLFTPGATTVESSGTVLSVRDLALIEDPANTVLLADSAEGAARTQTFRIRRDKEEGLALRHNGKGHVLFSDSHIEAVDATRAERLGFPHAYEPIK